MSQITVFSPANWMSRQEALEKLQVSRTAFGRLIDEGQIRTRTFGLRRYWAEDVRRLASPPDAPPIQ